MLYRLICVRLKSSKSRAKKCTFCAIQFCWVATVCRDVKSDFRNPIMPRFTTSGEVFISLYLLVQETDASHSPPVKIEGPVQI